MKYPVEIEEKRTINRITLKQTFADFLNAFNVERGLVFTLRLLLTRPGKLVESYLEEGRFRIINPFRLLVLTTALSLLALYFLGFSEFIKSFTDSFNENPSTESAISAEGFQQVFIDFYNLMLWISIPCYALASYLVFRKAGYNFAEHLVCQCFYLSGVNVIYTVVFFAAFFMTQVYVFYLALALGILYFFVFFRGFIRRSSFVFYLQTFFTLLFANVAYWILLAGIFYVMALFDMIS